jgi:hypothetical protein
MSRTLASGILRVKATHVQGRLYPCEDGMEMRLSRHRVRTVAVEDTVIDMAAMRSLGRDLHTASIRMAHRSHQPTFS